MPGPDLLQLCPAPPLERSHVALTLPPWPPHAGLLPAPPGHPASAHYCPHASLVPCVAQVVPHSSQARQPVVRPAALSHTHLPHTHTHTPQPAATMTQGVIAEWCKKEGEAIKAGDSIAKIETDKATVDCECAQHTHAHAHTHTQPMRALSCCTAPLPPQPSPLHPNTPTRPSL